MSATSPTPRPWRFGRSSEDHKIILGANGRYACDVQIHQTPRPYGLIDEPERAANAELIVRAVNAHDELVAALKAVCAWHDHPALTGRPDSSPVPEDVPSFDDTVKMAMAAIAKAEGRQ